MLLLQLFLIDNAFAPFRRPPGAAHSVPAAVPAPSGLQRRPPALPLHRRPGGQGDRHTLASQRSAGDLRPGHGCPAGEQRAARLHIHHQVVAPEIFQGNVSAGSSTVAEYCSNRNDCPYAPSSELILFNVHVEARGEWECVVSTGRGNMSRSVEIVVLENSASFCPEEKVVNNRGEFRSVAGTVTVTVQVQVQHPDRLSVCFDPPQVAQNPCRHHLSSVLPAAALPLSVCRGRH